MTKCNFPITCPSDISKGFWDWKQIANYNMMISSYFIVFYPRVAIFYATTNSMMGGQDDFSFISLCVHVSRNYPFHWPSLPLISVPRWSVAGLDGHRPSRPHGVIVTGSCVRWLSGPCASLLPACLSSHIHGHVVWPCDYSRMHSTTPMSPKIV